MVASLLRVITRAAIREWGLNRAIASGRPSLENRHTGAPGGSALAAASMRSSLE